MLVIDSRALASATYAALLIISAAYVTRQKGRFAALGQEPASIPYAEFDFDLTYQDDRDAGLRAKFRLVSEKLESVTISMAVASAIAAFSTAIPDYALISIGIGSGIALAASLKAYLTYRKGAAYIDASTAYIIFIKKRSTSESWRFARNSLRSIQSLRSFSNQSGTKIRRITPTLKGARDVPPGLAELKRFQDDLN